MGLSLAGKKAFMSYTPCVTGSLSFVGSFLTLLIIARSASTIGVRHLTTYHRLMAGVSFFDLLLSLGLLLGPLMVPEIDIPTAPLAPPPGMTLPFDLPEGMTAPPNMDFSSVPESIKQADMGLPAAVPSFPGTGHGTIATCTLQGFLIQIGTASFAYSAMLILFYMLVIKFSVQDATISRYFEPLMHAVPILFHTSAAIVGLGMDMYNPRGSICWVNGSPPMCETEDAPFPIECERGSGHQRFFYLTNMPKLVWTVIILLALLVIVSTVWKKIRESRRFQFRLDASRTTGTMEGPIENPHEVRLRQVTYQALLYGLSFLNVIVWTTAVSLIPMSKFDVLGKHFWIAALGVFFFPLQGLFNFFIYIRPRYGGIRRRLPQKGARFGLKEAIWFPEASTKERLERSKFQQSAKESGNLSQDCNQSSLPKRPSDHLPQSLIHDLEQPSEDSLVTKAAGRELSTTFTVESKLTSPFDDDVTGEQSARDIRNPDEFRSMRGLVYAGHDVDREAAAMDASHATHTGAIIALSDEKEKHTVVKRRFSAHGAF